MEKSDAVSFTSSHFKIEQGEDEETNAGIYGKALARWLAEQLREKELAPKEPVPEDWGWCVIVKTKPVRLNIAVANVDSSPTRWRAFVFVERGLLQLFKDSGELKREVSALRENLAVIVAAAPGVSDISWETLS